MKADYFLSIVVPAYNEADVIETFHRRISTVSDDIERTHNQKVEILYVNDGSSDRTLLYLEQFHARDRRVSIVNLSRNFGKEIAMTAGMELSRGRAVVVIDADLQDPPELILEFIQHWQNGFDVVYGTRTRRDGETWLKKTTAHLFYRLIRRVSRVQIPQDTGDFRLMSRRVVDAICALREQHRFMKGLFAWVGYPSKAVMYRRDPRNAGETKFNYWKLWNFAIEGITSFSIAPLKVATYLGFIVAGAAFLFACWIILKTLLWGESVTGYPTLMVTMLFLGGAQLISIGALGEYVGRVFNETKGRPLYLVEKHLRAGDNPRDLPNADSESAALRSKSSV